MKKIDLLVKGRKLTEKLLGLKRKGIMRALDAAIDDLESQKENAVMDYENNLLKLADDKVDYKSVINAMISNQQTIHDADATIEVINKVKEDLESEVEDESKEQN